MERRTRRVARAQRFLDENAALLLLTGVVDLAAARRRLD
jgi:hypothetical protein